MKVLAALLLVPMVALAQTPDQGMDRVKLLDKMKQHMLPMLEKSLPEMAQTKQCVQASGNSAELKRCAEMMQAFQRKMMAEMAPPAAPGAAEGGRPSASAPPPQQQMPEIEWSEQKRDEIVKGMDSEIKLAKAMTSCLRSSNTPEEMDACMKSSGLSQNRP